MGVIGTFLRTYKKPLLYVGGSIFAILGLWYGIVLLTTGAAAISLNDQSAKVSVYQQGNAATPTLISTHTGDTTKRLSPGNYIIQASTSKGASSQSVTITARNTQEVTISIRQDNDTQVVASADAPALASNDQTLVYLDELDSKLKRITSSNAIEVISDAIIFKRFEWLDFDFGVGLASDNQLYTYNGTQTTPQRIAGTQPADLSRFSVAPDRTIYASGGTNVYRYTPGAGFITIDTATPEARLTASSSGVLVTSSISVNQKKQDATLIKTNGNKTTAELPRYNDASWSKDGRRLALATQFGVLLYDSNLEFIGSVPISSSVSSLAWANNILTYASSNGLWGYDVATKISTKITGLQEGAARAIQAPNSNGFIYFSIDKSDASGGNQQIAKTSIKKFSIPNNVQKTQELLPVSTAEYNIDFINLTRPTIYISSAQFSDNSYKDAAKNFLEDNNINTNGMTIVE